VGRGMKVAKEQVVGMVAAVDWLLEQSDEKNQAEYMRLTNIIIDAVKDVPTMKSRVFMPPISNHVPHLLLAYDPTVVGVTPKQVQDTLRAQKPSIELNPATGTTSRVGIPSDENTIVIATWMMQPGEAEIVGRSLRSTLMQHHA
jgi:L-seryl-tRNA(Ser) seleniumtransferase